MAADSPNKCAVDFLSDDNSQYVLPTWWDSEYQKCEKDDVYEWFTGCYDPKFMETVMSLIASREARIINLGCGISRVQEALFDAGFHNITNVDVSPACIDLMRESDTRGMKWEIVDVLKRFPYDDGSFDFAFDKGTLDALIVDHADKWEIEPETYETAAVYFREVSRCLAPGGVFVQVSFGQPHFRRRLFEQSEFNWTVKVHTIDPVRSFHFFLYECKKNE